MAVNIDATTNLTEAYDAESDSGWTTNDDVSLYSGFQREDSNCLGMQCTNTDTDGIWAYTTITSANLTGKRVYAWMAAFIRPETKANGGFRIVIGDGTNVRAYYVGGSDDFGFQVGLWSCFMLDVSNLPSNYYQIAGSSAPSITAITQMGVAFRVAMKAVGTVDNVFFDICRHGTGIIVTGGGIGTEGTFAEIAADDASTSAGKAYGILREILPGVFGLQGDIIFGDESGSDSVYFKDTDAFIVLEDHVHGSGTPTEFNLDVVNDTGTASIEFGVAVGSGDSERGRNGVSFLNANQDNTWNLDCSDADIDDIEFYGCSFTGVNGDLVFSDDATNGPTHRLSGCTFSECAQVDPNRVRVRNCVFSGYTADADAALLWNANIDIKNCLFVACTDATNDPHAIEHDTAGTFYYYGLTFSGNDYDINFSAASGDLVINNMDGSDASTYEITGSGSSVTINTSVDVDITVQDAGDLSDVQGAIVLLKVASGGDLPFEESVSIVRSGDTATVTHASHGLKTSDKVHIKGADQPEYNGVKTITVTGTNTYTYTVSGTPDTPATGTITSTYVVLHDTTDVNGEVSTTHNFTSNQPVAGKVRRGTSSPLFKTAPLAGTITSAGYIANAFLVSDE